MIYVCVDVSGGVGGKRRMGGSAGSRDRRAEVEEQQRLESDSESDSEVSLMDGVPPPPPTLPKKAPSSSTAKRPSPPPVPPQKTSTASKESQRGTHPASAAPASSTTGAEKVLLAAAPVKGVERVRATVPSSTASRAGEGDVRCVCLSGFAGEERAMLTDILHGLVNTTSLCTSSSSSSSEGAGNGGNGRCQVSVTRDDDTSLKTLMTMTHVVAASENPRYPHALHIDA